MILQINRKDLIKQQRWPLRCLWSAFSEEWKENKYDFEGWKKLAPRSLICVLNICLTGKENDWAMSLSLAPVAVRGWAGGRWSGCEELAADKSRVWGSCAGLGCAVRAAAERSPDGRIYTKALIVWLIKAGSILTKTAPFLSLPSPCALRNPCAGAAVMRKRQQNWGVVREDNSARTDSVTRDHPCRWLTGACRGVSTCACRVAWVLRAEASPWHRWGCR